MPVLTHPRMNNFRLTSDMAVRNQRTSRSTCKKILAGHEAVEELARLDPMAALHLGQLVDWAGGVSSPKEKVMRLKLLTTVFSACEAEARVEWDEITRRHSLTGVVEDSVLYDGESAVETSMVERKRFSRTIPEAANAELERRRVMAPCYRAAARNLRGIERHLHRDSGGDDSDSDSEMAVEDSVSESESDAPVPVPARQKRERPRRRRQVPMALSESESDSDSDSEWEPDRGFHSDSDQEHPIRRRLH